MCYAPFRQASQPARMAIANGRARFSASPLRQKNPGTNTKTKSLAHDQPGSFFSDQAVTGASHDSPARKVELRCATREEQRRRDAHSCYHGVSHMPPEKLTQLDAPAELALRLPEALQRERIIPRFVDSYVIENGRQALQVHAALYRDLLALLRREALLALTARALEVAYAEPLPTGRSKPKPMPRKDAVAFRRKLLAALTKQQKWSAGDALDFQSDLQLYEELLARNASARRFRKPFEAANHPFVDRSAFVLDSSFLEKARVAASRALNELEALAAKITGAGLQQQTSQSAHAKRSKPLHK